MPVIALIVLFGGAAAYSLIEDPLGWFDGPPAADSASQSTDTAPGAGPVPETSDAAASPVDWSYLTAAEVDTISRCHDLAAASLRHIQMLDAQLQGLSSSEMPESDDPGDIRALFAQGLVEQGEAIASRASAIGCSDAEMESMIRTMAAESPHLGPMVLGIRPRAVPSGQDAAEVGTDE